MNNTNNAAPVRRSWRPEPWLMAIVLFFLVVFAVNALMIRLSLQSWTGEVTDGAYRKGLAYNQTLEAQQQQDALGWQITLEHTPLQVGRSAMLQLQLRDSRGHALPGATIQGVFYRPSSKAADLPLRWAEKVPGQYVASLSPTLPGHWEVRLTVQRENAQFRHVQRLEVAAASQGE
ncbi:MAG: FixH family protein [Magnetococcales bacterium]|nr:FixH family protein [Magnetococcales bacterium]MBF0113795.1 FixH family protein [Magnetococcales bacterium]